MVAAAEFFFFLAAGFVSITVDTMSRAMGMVGIAAPLGSLPVEPEMFTTSMVPSWKKPPGSCMPSPE